MKLKAAIFDLNGTVLSDEDEYGEAFARVLRRLGVEVTSKYPHISGIGVEENWEIFLRELNLEIDKSAAILAAETQREYLKMISRLRLKKGFESFIETLRADGVRTALATSNTWMIVERIFEVFEIEKYFDFVTTAEEVTLNKPDPEIFELTLSKLQVEPTECLVIEDSHAGIEAAHKAGMKAIGIARSKTYREKISNADKIVENFNQIKYADILSM